jgi:hypothetical protein
LFQSPVCPSPIIDLKPPVILNEPASTSNSIEIVAVPSELNIDDTPAIPITNDENKEDEMIDDEDFVDSSDDELDDEFEGVKKLIPIDRNQLPLDEMEHKALLPNDQPSSSKKTFKARLVKGLSLGNLKFPFRSPSTSPKMKKSKSSSMLVDIEKEKLLKSTTESFSSEESDLYFSMDHTKESWHVDVSNINYFLNQTGMQEQHQGVRNSMSPITKSTQRMPKSMQESIMTPRSRKPVMVTMFGNNLNYNSDPKSYQTNISQLLEESEEVSDTTASKESSGSNCSIPLNDIAAANDNGLPVIEDGYSSAFKDYMYQNGKFLCEADEQDDDNSFASQSSDDYESSSEYQKLQESQDETSTQEVDIDKIINQSTSNLSKSLLHVLDGNDCSQISPQGSFEKSRKRQLSDSSSKEVESSPDSIKKPLLDTAENDSTDF